MNLKEQLMSTPINSPSKFIGRLFEARDVAHLEHLKVKFSRVCCLLKSVRKKN